MLLAIVSKMSKEGLLNEKAKGLFMNLIIKRIIKRFNNLE